MEIGGGNRFSRTLIGLQFALSISLVVGALVMSRQVEYLKTRSLGFDGDQVVFCDMTSSRGDEMLERYRNELGRHPEILGVAGAWPAPGISDYWKDDAWQFEGRAVELHRCRIDGGFLETLGIELVAGRNFDDERSTDASEAVIINEAMAEVLGWEDPVGRRLVGLNEASAILDSSLALDPVVIGVVEDFPFYSLHRRIPPTVFQTGYQWTRAMPQYRVIFVRLDREGIAAGMDVLMETWERLSPDRAFEFAFLDDRFDSFYREEERWSRIVRLASGLAVLIACMGLFGLASFTVERRTREIGIRKALGASVPHIFLLLAREFTCWVVVAHAIAWPLAYFAMQRWLQDFAYRISPGAGVFAAGGILALALALVSVSYQAIRAALANPVKALRYE